MREKFSKIFEIPIDTKIKQRIKDLELINAL